jgi:hypothetical protein
VTKISSHLCKTDLGEHAMLVYDDASSFREIYSSHCKKALASERNSVMILSHYETKPSVIQAIAELELPTELHERNGSLIITDASEILSKSGNIVDFLRYLMTAEMSAKKRGKDRLDIIIDMGCFYHLGRTNDISKYEETISSRKDKQSTIICCYNQKDLARVDSPIREKVLGNHDKSFAIVENA